MLSRIPANLPQMAIENGKGSALALPFLAYVEMSFGD